MYSVDHHTFRTSDKSLPSIQSISFGCGFPRANIHAPNWRPLRGSPSGAGPRCALAVDESLRYRPPTTVSVSGAHPPPHTPLHFPLPTPPHTHTMGNSTQRWNGVGGPPRPNWYVPLYPPCSQPSSGLKPARLPSKPSAFDFPLLRACFPIPVPTYILRRSPASATPRPPPLHTST